MVSMHSVRHWALRREELRREVAGAADERLKSRRGCMGNETRWLTGATYDPAYGFHAPAEP